MQFDAQLIAAAIDSRTAFEKIAAHFDESEFSNPLSKFWFPLIKAWYAQDRNAVSVDKSLLVEAGRLRIQNPKHVDNLTGFIRDLPSPPSADNVVQIALEFKRFNVGMELGAAIASRNETSIDRLLPRLAALRQATALDTSTEEAEWEFAAPVEELFAKVGTENRIEIAPSRLNERVGGGALPGHHVILFGRSGIGKSSFSVNMANSFVRREIKVLYVGNEDQINVLKMRMLCRVTGLTQQEVEANLPVAYKMFRERGGEDFLVMARVKKGTMTAAARLVEQVKPQVIIFDQIRNMRTGSGLDNDMTKKLEQLAIGARQLLLDYGLIGVSVTQQNDRQPSPLWLEEGDIDSSHTGLPAQGDLIVGISATDEMKSNDTRALSMIKNKLSSASNAHQGFIVNIDRARSRIW